MLTEVPLPHHQELLLCTTQTIVFLLCSRPLLLYHALVHHPRVVVSRNVKVVSLEVIKDRGGPMEVEGWPFLVWGSFVKNIVTDRPGGLAFFDYG